MTQIKIELSDAVAEKLGVFLAEHPQYSISSLLEESIHTRQFPNNSPQKSVLADIDSDNTSSPHIEGKSVNLGHLLKGSVLRYDDPFEPAVVSEEWNALQ